MSEPLLLISVVAKLVGIGLSGWKAHGSGLATDEAKVFHETLASIPTFAGLLAKGPITPDLLGSYSELISVSFGEAWRRHWMYNSTLAPKEVKRSWRDWFRSEAQRARVYQVETALRSGTFQKTLLGDGSTNEELSLLDRVADPLSSPWYQALWKAFSQQSPLDEEDTRPPLLLLGEAGDDRREFERHFVLAFAEGLASDRGRSLREWLRNTRSDRQYLMRQLLAAKLSSMRDEHVFGNAGEFVNLPRLPLEALYVEPYACRRRFNAAATSTRPIDVPQPVLELIGNLLRDPETRVIILLADFGRGKSLTARTLAYQMAERFLSDRQTPSPELEYPIFVRCHESLKRRALDAETTVRSAQKRLAESFLGNADSSDAALGFPENQKTVVLLDGLDEVQLSSTDTRDLFSSLLDKANQQRRFIVFSRPAAVPHDLQKLAAVTTLDLEDFTTGLASPSRRRTIPPPAAARSQVEEWLERWARLAPEPHPTLELLRQRDLLTLCATPVLLCMVAQTWASVHTLQNVRRVDVYDQFIQLTARSKLEYDQQHHPVIDAAAQALRDQLVVSKNLPEGARTEHAMIELLGRVAWRAQQLEQDTQQEGEPQPLTGLHVKNILNELGLRGDKLELVERGVVLTLSQSLGDGEEELHFAHRSFREFLIAKHWERRLLRILDARRNNIPDIEKELLGARLLQPGDASYSFLAELCQRWQSPERARLLSWAQETFNDEALDSHTLRTDGRYALRETALAIGSEIAKSAGDITADSELTLATLLASFSARAATPIIRARWLSHVGANLSTLSLLSADLRNTDLSRANFRRANLQTTDLRDANLQGANFAGASLLATNLERANLRGAIMVSLNMAGHSFPYGFPEARVAQHLLLRSSLEVEYPMALHRIGVNFRSAVLDEADFTAASLQHSLLTGARCCNASFHYVDLRNVEADGATFEGSVFRRATLQGGKFNRANFRTATLELANCRGATFANADLTGASLRKANLQRADLIESVLRKADLCGAKLQHAKLQNAKLEGALWNHETRFPDNFKPEEHGMILQAEDPSND